MDINRFFDTSEHREWIRSPFNVDGRTCATNGHMLLTLPEYGEFSKGEESIANGVRSILSDIKGVEFKPMPDIEVPEKETCDTCAGTGKAQREKCYECDGDGEVDAETDYSTYYGLECKSCDGHGVTTNKGGDKNCPDCIGTGKRHNKTIPIAIEGMHVNLNFLSIIIDEKEVEIGKIKDKAMLAFRCGDQTGIFMGMHP